MTKTRSQTVAKVQLKDKSPPPDTKLRSLTETTTVKPREKPSKDAPNDKEISKPSKPNVEEKQTEKSKETYLSINSNVKLSTNSTAIEEFSAN